MSIDNVNGNSTGHLGLAKTNKGNAQAAGGPKQDLTTTGPTAQTDNKVSISQRANQLARLEEKIDTAPPVNKERVAEIRQALSDGSYKIDADAIADRLLGQDKYFQ